MGRTTPNCERNNKMTLKLSRTQKVMILVRDMALEEYRLIRAEKALAVFDLLKDNETEKWLIEYYKGVSL